MKQKLCSLVLTVLLTVDVLLDRAPLAEAGNFEQAADTGT